MEKLPIFGQNHGLTPSEKIFISRLFQVRVFIAQKGVLSFQNIVKDIFLPYIIFKKKMEKWPIFGQNHGLTLLEKSQFFDIFNLVFLQPRKAFFPSRILLKDIFLPFIIFKLKREKWPIFCQNHGLTPLEKSQFFDFFNFVFLQPRKAFFRSRIS